MVKSFITHYLIQYYEKPFQDELFLSIYSILQMEFYFPGLVTNDSLITALHCLESVANDNRRVPSKKTTRKKMFNS